MPGETITIDGDDLTIDGRSVKSEKVRTEGKFEIFRETIGDASYEIALGPDVPPNLPASMTIEVPADHLFVMGDNRHDAFDSRYMGPIAFRTVTGKKW